MYIHVYVTLTGGSHVHNSKRDIYDHRLQVHMLSISIIYMDMLHVVIVSKVVLQLYIDSQSNVRNHCWLVATNSF